MSGSAGTVLGIPGSSTLSPGAAVNAGAAAAPPSPGGGSTPYINYPAITSAGWSFNPDTSQWFSPSGTVGDPTSMSQFQLSGPPIDPGTLATGISAYEGIYGASAADPLGVNPAFIPTAGNPNFTLDPSGDAVLSPAGSAALTGQEQDFAAQVAANNRKNASGIGGFLSTPLGALSILGLPLAVGGAGALLGADVAAGAGSGAADLATADLAGFPGGFVVPPVPPADAGAALGGLSAADVGGSTAAGGTLADLGGAGAAPAADASTAATALGTATDPSSLFIGGTTASDAGGGAVGGDLTLGDVGGGGLVSGPSAASVGPVGGTGVGDVGSQISAGVDTTSGFDTSGAAAGGGAGSGGGAGNVGLLQRLGNWTGLTDASKALGVSSSDLLRAGVAGAGLAYNLSKTGGGLGTANVPGAIGNESALAAQTGAQGQQLASYLASGTLPPNVQANLNQATQNAITQIKAKYAGLGIAPGSTMEQQDINSVMLQAQATSGQIENQLLQTGATYTNIDAGLLQNILTANVGLNNQTQSAISNLAASLAGGGNTVTVKAAPGTTATTS